MLLSYTGKEPCAGCKRPGSEAARIGKNELCEDCKKLLLIGKMSQKLNDTVKYKLIGVEWYYFWRNDLNDCIYKFLDEINNADAECEGGMIRIFRCGTTASNFYKVPTVLAKPLEEMMRGISQIGQKIYSIEKELEEKKQDELREEKNKIFNEGIKYGRNLLFQLNRGEITAEEINKEIKKY